MGNPKNILSPVSKSVTQNRRQFLSGLVSTGAFLTLNYSPAVFATTTSGSGKIYRAFEDVYREKWAWDRVVHGIHGTNCAGNRRPMAYLRNLFGEEVDDALTTSHYEMERKKEGKTSGLMDLLIAKDWKSMFNIPDVRLD